MDCKKIFALACFSVTSFAGTMGTINDLGLRPVAAVFGGAAWENLNNRNASFFGTDDQSFRYQFNNNNSANGFGGGFLGFEHKLYGDNIYVQFGAEYDNFVKNTLKGTSYSGIQPNTSTVYQQQYEVSTQQAMASAKFFNILNWSQLKGRNLYPYFNVALGAAFNRAKNFSTYTTETGSINLIPLYADGSNTNFSYNLGVGIDADVVQHVRLGIGYRYSNFGRASLGNGSVRFNQYIYPVNYNLSSSNFEANQFIAQLTLVA